MDCNLGVNLVEKNKQKIKQYREDNKEKYKQYHQENKKQRAKRLFERYRSDVLYKITMLLRSRLCMCLKRKTKSAPTLELLGCSVEFLKKHLEEQFTEGMTWDNHAVHGWHIDHIKPCDKFDLSKESEQRACFHYTNLQPLWAVENFKKGSRYEF